MLLYISAFNSFLLLSYSMNILKLVCHSPIGGNLGCLEANVNKVMSCLFRYIISFFSCKCLGV